MKEVDLFIFSGQSNIAGRGGLKKATEPLTDAWEFRAVSDPTGLYPLLEPFGAAENNPQGINEPKKKTGSLTAAFLNSYTKETQHQAVAVSASKGGSAIKEWQPGQPYLNDALARLKRAQNYLQENTITIKGIYLVWCQGETDGDHKTSAKKYQRLLKRTFQAYFNAGVQQVFLIAIGNYRDDKKRYQKIRNAQIELAVETSGVLLVSDSFRNFDGKRGMKDAYHFQQFVYDQVGAEAGQRAGEFIRVTH